MDGELLEKFQRFVYEKSDLHFSLKKRAFFEKRLMGRLAKCGLADAEEYYVYLSEHPSEMDALVQELTTNQTYFFRNASQFRALSDKVIPSLVESKNRRVVSSWGRLAGTGTDTGATGMPGRNSEMSLSVWSAGCSTGEEAYSIAFTLLGAIRYSRAWDLEVLATDISRDVLAAAMRGVYEEDSLRDTDPEVRDRFMELTVSGWRVGEEARRIIRFCAANIKDVTRSGDTRVLKLEGSSGNADMLDARERFDVVFCRNVMIYFDREGQQRLVDALYDCIKPGGYLFTGDSEPLHLFSHGFKRADDKYALYYIKPE